MSIIAVWGGAPGWAAWEDYAGVGSRTHVLGRNALIFTTKMSTRPDTSKLASLANILRQEQANDFADSTVIGGLDRFLQRWADELRPVLGEFSSYSVLTSLQRKEWVEAALSRLPEGERAGAPPRRRRAPAQACGGSGAGISLDDDVIRLRAVTSQNLARVQRLNVSTVSDLVYLFPHRHNDFANIRTVSQLQPGEEQTVVVTVWEASETGWGRRRSTQAILGDETGNVRAIWFNNRYMARTLRSGAQVVISGRVNLFRGQLVFESPEYELLHGQEELVHTGRLVPVYPSTEGLPQRTIRRIVKQALDACLSHVAEFLPEELRHRTGLMGVQNAIAQAHYPDSPADWNAARRRLAFDELLLLQLAVLDRRRRWREEAGGVSVTADTVKLGGFLRSLPFELTGAQTRALGEILDDLSSDKPMSRLLQGDVGSGKTVVAVAALLAVALDGHQGAMMAPTEILAEQHFMTVARLLSESSDGYRDDTLLSVSFGASSTPITIGLLIGSLPQRVKDDMHQRIADGEVDIVIGTHALIQASVEIPRLALVVVDEQQRFGVMQRASLREKGERPHLLAMSATPIPRSLALTVYGDLDSSIIDEMPPGRTPIRTRWVEPDRREAAYSFVRGEVEAGRQAFIVCPLIEESEIIQTRAATEEYERLSAEVYPDLRLGLLHGRMALREKEQVMELFQRQELDILVSTPVVEVGIDVPNATVMLVDGADRFGLAQLHQFRGRVGRGAVQSYCLLLADSPGEDARERLKIVERIVDGFELAEEDLRLRGPGDYLGTRQSGLPDLRIARITDQDILSLARREARKLLDSDPELSKEENSALAEHFRRSAAALSGEMS